jgi:hypothetical protein
MGLLSTLLESRKARVARVGWWIRRSRRPPPEVVYDALLIHPPRARLRSRINVGRQAVADRRGYSISLVYTGLVVFCSLEIDEIRALIVLEKYKVKDNLLHINTNR